MVKWLMANRRKVFIVTMLLSFVSIFQVLNLKSEFSYRVWFQEDDKYMAVYDDFKEVFGNEDFLSIALYRKKGVLTAPMLDYVGKISEDLYDLDNVKRVDSLSTVSVVKGTGDELDVTPLYEPSEVASSSKQQIKEIRKSALDNNVLKNYLINKAGDVTIIYLRVDARFDKSKQYGTLYRSVQNYMNKNPPPKDVDVHMTGTVSIIPALATEITSDIKVIIPALLAVLFLILMFIYRSFIQAITPFLIVAVTLVVTFAIATFMGVTYNPVTSMAPHILTALCISDSIHIISSFIHYLKHGMVKEDALRHALKSNFMPTLLTSITTSVGFFSLMMADIKPIAQLGAVAGIGTLLAWLFSYTALPWILSAISYKNVKIIDETKGEVSKRAVFTGKYLNFIKKNVYPIFLISAIVLVGALNLASKNQVNSQSVNMLSKGNDVRVANNFLKQKLGGANGVEIIINNKANKVGNDVLGKVEQLENFMLGKKEVIKVLSVNNLIKDLHQALENGDEKAYSLPKDDEKLREVVFLYQMMAPEQIENWITRDQDKMRVSIIWNTKGSARANAMISEIETFAKDIGLDATVTGKTSLLKGTNKYLVELFFMSISCAIGLIFVIMCFYLRSIPMALLSLIPNLSPIILGAGVMKLLGLEIDFGTVMVSSVCLGIAIDDTIHFLHNYRNNIVKRYDNVKCLANTLSHTGFTLITTTIVLIMSFSSFLLGQVSINFNFGLLTIFMLLFALVADLLILPAILIKIPKIARTMLPKEARLTE